MVNDESQDVVVSPGNTATAAFTITCNPIPPATGSVRVTTSTSGPDQDADGYQFTIDGGSAQGIQTSGSQTVAGVSEGPHTVALSGLAGNCTVDNSPKGVSVTGGATADVSFTITCIGVGPSASQSSMLADPKNIPTGGSSTITVTVRNASGTPVPGVAVSLSSSGTGNTITEASPGSGTTNSSGVATFTFSSTVGGDKTITATAGGVTLNDTEVIVVSRRSSSIQITGDANDPSGPGETITVTFSVAFDGGGIPTGTVDIFSLEEALVGCTVDVSAGSCTFALNTPGLHHLQASYSGDNQFVDSSDPDGEEHTVSSPTP
jgi:hypothetical protein